MRHRIFYRQGAMILCEESIMSPVPGVRRNRAARRPRQAEEVSDPSGRIPPFSGCRAPFWSPARYRRRTPLSPRGTGAHADRGRRSTRDEGCLATGHASNSPVAGVARQDQPHASVLHHHPGRDGGDLTAGGEGQGLLHAGKSC